MPTSYTTSWHLTSDAYGRCRFLYAFSVAPNRSNSWLSVFRATPAFSGLGACLLFLHQRQEARQSRKVLSDAAKSDEGGDERLELSLRWTELAVTG
jgi:hypothetical protein